MNFVRRDISKLPSYGGSRLTVIRLIEVFLQALGLRSAGTCQGVRLRGVSVLRDFTTSRKNPLKCPRLPHRKYLK